MSVEPEVVDTNVLVYALDADAPQHAANSRLRRRRTASSGYDRPLRFSAQPTPEEHLSAVLLRMVLDHCTSSEGTLDSFGRVANGRGDAAAGRGGFDPH
jgi:hypothetical protein